MVTLGLEVFWCRPTNYETRNEEEKMSACNLDTAAAAAAAATRTTAVPTVAAAACLRCWSCRCHGQPLLLRTSQQSGTGPWDAIRCLAPHEVMSPQMCVALFKRWQRRAGQTGKKRPKLRPSRNIVDVIFERMFTKLMWWRSLVSKLLYDMTMFWVIGVFSCDLECRCVTWRIVMWHGDVLCAIVTTACSCVVRRDVTR